MVKGLDSKEYEIRGKIKDVIYFMEKNKSMIEKSPRSLEIGTNFIAYLEDIYGSNEGCDKIMFIRDHSSNNYFRSLSNSFYNLRCKGR